MQPLWTGTWSQNTLDVIGFNNSPALPITVEKQPTTETTSLVNGPLRNLQNEWKPAHIVRILFSDAGLEQPLCKEYME